ncbi:signal peptidase II [Nostocoides sp. HKS02]|uniref:signal peptidase II n=1 Tax=Nostocoides sp. HKS02 TaxID=1813880 RepID=UPI0012B4890F|nr:signal peptidase II [Tetrasphaera sp. HKS02]QGN57618.1 signal peptidase II [Tetrasphaera sp. HKS02]
MQDEAGAPLIAADESSGVPDTAPDPHSTRPPRQRTLFVLMGVTAVVAYAADQVSKVVALDRLTPGEPVAVVGDLIRLNLIRNAGAAFSIGNGATWVMTLIACGVLVFILRTARRIGSAAWAWALGLLLGGSLGNLTDRMVRPPGPGRGHVVDFIDYFGLFIGNVADIAIVGAAAFIAVLAWRGIGVDGIRAHHGRHEAGLARTTTHDSVDDDGAAHV